MVLLALVLLAGLKLILSSKAAVGICTSRSVCLENIEGLLVAEDNTSSALQRPVLAGFGEFQPPALLVLGQHGLQLELEHLQLEAGPGVNLHIFSVALAPNAELPPPPHWCSPRMFFF